MDSSSLEKSIKDSALSLLARREHSQKELSDKLQRKYSDKELIARVLLSLVDFGLQSDERFVESFIRWKKSLGKGPNFIRQELRQKGVSEFLIASYIYDDDENWYDLASDVYLKKFGYNVAVDGKEKARRVRFMVSRGFSPDTAFKLMSDESLAIAI